MTEQNTKLTVVESPSLIEVISRAASDPNVDVDKMKALLQIKRDVMADDARIAFTRALAEMQPKLPVIEQRGQGHNLVYATWEDINEAIRPVLAEHGFALTFRTGREDKSIVVTAVLSHRDGHSEKTSLLLPADTSGSKNDVQAVGSSTSYGKRYTCCALLNITSRLPADRDDNGVKACAGEEITGTQAAEILNMIDETSSDIKKFCAFMNVRAIPEISLADYGKATAALMAAKAKRGSHE